MKKFILTIVYTLLVCSLGYSQTGQGYINYKSYKINGGDGSCGSHHPSTTEAFDAMFDYQNNDCTDLTHEGVDTALNGLTWTWSTMLPRHANQWFGWDIQGYFVPPTSGTYSFQISSDDRSDFWFDTDGDGVMEDSNAGFGNGTRIVQINVNAGQPYPFRVRYEQGEGGASLYLKWLSPENAAAGAPYSFNSNSIWSYNPDTYVEPLHYDVNFKFGNGIDPSTFSVRTNYRVSENQTAQNENTTSIGLDGWGEATITSQIDETLYSDGTKKFRAIPDESGIATVLGSNQYGTGNLRFYIDKRMFADGFDFGSITSVEILDIYSGPMEFQNTDPSSIWQFYKIEGLTLTRDIVSQSEYYLPNGYAPTGIYEMNPQNNYAYPDFVVPNNWAVEDATSLREQFVVFDSSTYDTSMIDNIFTVSDVYLAFKELANSGIGMNEGGNEYQYGIQYAHSDVNRDGVFNFEDTFMMMDFLNGGTLFDTSYLATVMKLTKTSEYNSISSTNWNTHMVTRTMYPLNLNTTDKNYDIDVTVSWLGDINLSHSPTPTNNLSVTGKSFRPTLTKKNEGDVETFVVSKLIDNTLEVTLRLNPKENKLKGVQYNVYFDTTKLEFQKVETNSTAQNFGTSNGKRVSVGSIITSGDTILDNTTEYRIIFKTKEELKNILGLIYVKPIDSVNENGDQLVVKII